MGQIRPSPLGHKTLTKPLEMTLTELSTEGHMYNLRYERHANTGDEVLMYNSLVEIDTTTGTRLHTLALKYDPETRASELVTFI